VIEEMQDWSVRALDEVYAAIFVDAIVVKVRDGQVANRPFYAAIGVTLDGERDILGLWAGQGGEGAKFWMSVLTDLKNRGVRDVFFLVCDGLKGLPEVVGNVWPQTIVQTCIIRLIRNTFRLASRRDWDALRRAIKPIYTAVNAAAAREAFDQLAETWGQRYPAIIRLWDNAWQEFIPFLDYGACRRITECSCEAEFVSTPGRPIVGIVGCVRRMALLGVGGGVDLHEVEGAGGKLEFAKGGVQSAAGESAEDCLEVSDCWFHGGAAPLVEGSSAIGSKAMLHRLPSGRVRGRQSVSGLVGGGLGLVAALAQGDQSIRAGSGEIGVGGVASVGEHRPDEMVLRDNMGLYRDGSNATLPPRAASNSSSTNSTPARRSVRSPARRAGGDGAFAAPATMGALGGERY
jgi:hypothetical protein